ncbi:MAG: DUF4376 domain-containing protein [Sulfuricella sp.]
MWRQLLEGRHAVIDGDLIEDPHCRLFALGFTVAEVEQAVGYAGYTSRQVDWYSSHPDRYQLVDEVWQEIEGWRAAQDAAELAQAIISKKAEIQREKCRLRDSGIMIDGVLFDTDASAQSAYTKTLLACQIDPTYSVAEWKASDGVFIKMTKPLVLQVMQESGSRESALTSTQKRKYAEVDALTTSAHVNRYDALSGW